MKLQIRLGYLVLAVIIVFGAVGAFIHLSGYRHQLEVDRLNTALYDRQKVIERYTIIVDTLKEYVTESETVIVSSSKAIKHLSKENDRLKELNIRKANTIGELNLRIKALVDSVAPSDTIVIVKDCDEEQGVFIKLPLSYNFTDQYVNLMTDINLEGKARMDFNINEFPLNVAIGYKRENIFDRKTMVSVVSTPSPYVDVEDFKFMVVEDKRKKPITYIAIGSGATLFGVLTLVLLGM